MNKAATALSISAAPNPIDVAQPVTVTATLTVTPPGAGTPTGSISVTGTATSGCTITLPATTCILSFTASGSQTVSASYGGDGNFLTSTAPNIIENVTPTVDLSVTIDDGVGVVQIISTVTYNIVVANAGPSSANGALLSDPIPTFLGNVTWTCTPVPPAICPNASGSGAINETITLNAGESLQYAMTGTVTGAIYGDTLTNTVTVTPAAGTDDTVLSNNSATDTDSIIDEIFKDGFE